jgi:hypothetical protein
MRVDCTEPRHTEDDVVVWKLGDTECAPGMVAVRLEVDGAGKATVFSFPVAHNDEVVSRVARSL